VPLQARHDGAAVRWIFGKHKAVEISALPDSDVIWCWEHLQENDFQSPWLREPYRSEVAREYCRRFEPQRLSRQFTGDLKATCLEIVTAGVRALAMQFHPDRGGDTAAMQSINLAAEHMRRLVKASA